MPTDIVLTKHLLTVLSLLTDHALPLDTLGSDLEVRAARSLTSSEVSAVVLFAKDRGWIAERKDRWDRFVYFITDAGRNALAGM